MDTLKILSDLYKEYFGVKAERIEALPQAGSDRRYWRLSDEGHSAIGTYGPDIDENRCFIGLADAFTGSSKPVPRVYAADSGYHCYLQEDLGDRSLFGELGNPDFRIHLEDTIRSLVGLQKTPRGMWMDKCQAHLFSRRQVMWDLNYFKYEYLKPSQTLFDEERLEDDFERLASSLTAIDDDFMGFMMRDCQSRNVMLTADGPKFIDFQGGRLGPVLYDAVSLLWQSRASLDKALKHEMLHFYADTFCDGDASEKQRMLESAGDIILFRTLQVLGAYGFRGLVQHRAHFILSIPGALSNLRELIDDGHLAPYSELLKVCESLIADPRFVGKIERNDKKTLTVEVFSFSYKKGYPSDFSGNGGGFMFDCRAMHNPGRYDRYKALTGRDKPVIDFLEDREEVYGFLQGAWSMTDPAVERYLARGFSNIQIGFGCTGGQHRSVYCAEKTATHIREIFPEAHVRIIHREQQSNI